MQKELLFFSARPGEKPWHPFVRPNFYYGVTGLASLRPTSLLVREAAYNQAVGVFADLAEDEKG